METENYREEIVLGLVRANATIQSLIDAGKEDKSVIEPHNVSLNDLSGLLNELEVLRRNDFVTSVKCGVCRMQTNWSKEGMCHACRVIRRHLVFGLPHNDVDTFGSALRFVFILSTEAVEARTRDDFYEFPEDIYHNQEDDNDRTSPVLVMPAPMEYNEDRRRMESVLRFEQEGIKPFLMQMGITNGKMASILGVPKPDWMKMKADGEIRGAICLTRLTYWLMTHFPEVLSNSEEMALIMKTPEFESLSFASMRSIISLPWGFRLFPE